MSEQWPPHWGDPEGEDLDAELPENGQSDTGDLDKDALASHLAQVSSALASVPMPTLPDAFATRIGAAIAAEAATRACEAATGGENTGTVGESDTVRSISPLGLGARRTIRRRGASRASGPAGSRPPGRWRKRLVSAPVMAPLLICLVLGGFGYLFTRIGGTSSSSSVASSAAGTATSPLNRAAASSTAPYSELLPNGIADKQGAFTVTETGTRYAAATLATQVHNELAAAQGASTPSASASAGAAHSASTGASVAARGLTGCVYHLTGNARPSLVDRATYAGKPAYIIAVPSKVWVVGLGCTAANPELITTIALTGLSGNLRALGSV